MKNYLFTLLLILWGSSQSIIAQQYNFSNYSLEEGLPQSQALTIHQDKRGFLWIGTMGGGLCRFDGINFEVFTQKDGLIEQHILDIFEDSKGNLWFVEPKGITMYDGKKFINYFHEIHFQGADLAKVVEDHQGRIWFYIQHGATGRKILYYQKGKFTDFTQQYPELTQNNVISHLSITDQGILLIPTKKALYEYDGKKLYLSFLNHHPLIQNYPIQQILQDRQGNLWITSSQEGNLLFKYQRNNLSQIPIPVKAQNAPIRDMLVDSKNNLWLATYGEGVLKYDGQSFQHFTVKNGMARNRVFCLTEDNQGNIWMGLDGGGIVRYSGDRFVFFNQKDGLKSLTIRPVFEDDDKNIWFGMVGKGIAKFDGKAVTTYLEEMGTVLGRTRGFIQLDNKDILISSDAGLWQLNEKGEATEVSEKYGLPAHQRTTNLVRIKDDLWIGLYEQGLVRYNLKSTEYQEYTIQKHKFLSNKIHFLEKDSKGNLWICSNIGVTKYDGKKFTNYTTKDGLPDRWILHMAEDKFGRLWFASFGKGLSVFDGKKFKTISTKDGLSTDIIYSILTDQNGNLWAGSQKGIEKIELGDKGEIKKIKPYGKTEGFIGIETNGQAAIKDSNGYLWFGTINGLIRYNSKADHFNSTPPTINLTGIRLFFKKVDWTHKPYQKYCKGTYFWFSIPKKLVLPYKLNHVSFDFDAISYQAPEKIRYQWKLEGFDKEWSPVSYKPEAIYSNLPPGEYTLKIKASNSDGTWTEKPKTYSFEILTPIWMTWWFIGLILLGMALLIYLVVRLRIRSIKLKKEELERQVAKKTLEVRKQNKEILAQSYLLEEQKNELLTQTEELRQQQEENLAQREFIQQKNKDLNLQNKQILSSIHSAQNIQRTILPFEHRLKRVLNDHFVVYLPKDIVSGDFYWLYHTQNTTLVAVIDCTGHGVQGAFMSMISYTLLNEIVNQQETQDVGMILTQLHFMTRKALKQESSNNQDGMDICLCSIERLENGQVNLQYAGAKRSLYYIVSGNSELKELKGDRKSIAGWQQENHITFTTQKMVMEKDTCIYLTSDGYVDTPDTKRKKFGIQKFKKMLTQNAHLPMDKQKQVLLNELENYKGEADQRDDITVLGVKL